MIRTASRIRRFGRHTMPPLQEMWRSAVGTPRRGVPTDGFDTYEIVGTPLLFLFPAKLRREQRPRPTTINAAQDDNP